MIIIQYTRIILLRDTLNVCTKRRCLGKLCPYIYRPRDNDDFHMNKNSYEYLFLYYIGVNIIHMITEKNNAFQ